MHQGNSQSGVTHLSAAERTSAEVRPFSRTRPDGFAAGGVHKPKFVAKGHDAQLERAQFGKIPVRVRLMSGADLNGLIVKRDKFTITIHYTQGDDMGLDEIVYKHAIEGVLLKVDPVSQE